MYEIPITSIPPYLNLARENGVATAERNDTTGFAFRQKNFGTVAVSFWNYF
jgi:hypothetical protein